MCLALPHGVEPARLGTTAVRRSDLRILIFTKSNLPERLRDIPVEVIEHSIGSVGGSRLLMPILLHPTNQFDCG
jgi:hypothetical protein